jgi:hypothetical protein
MPTSTPVTPIFDKRRQIPPNGHYPQERRMNALYDAMLKMAPPASAVGESIVEIIQSGSWQLRHPLGPLSEPFLQYRASVSDEQWIDLRALDSDREFAAVVKRDFASSSNCLDYGRRHQRAENTDQRAGSCKGRR